jgi:hypothetical protein
MDRGRLTLFVRSLAEVRSRRTALGTAAVVATDLLTRPEESVAKPTHHHRHRPSVGEAKKKHKKPCRSPTCPLHRHRRSARRHRRHRSARVRTIAPRVPR